MRLSSRSRYGLRLMIYLATWNGQGPQLLKDIASREELSEKYLGQLIILLKNAQLVKSVRGAHGGYELAKNPESITVKEIVLILEGDLLIVDSDADSNTAKKPSLVVTKKLWDKISDKFSEILGSLTLKDLVEETSKIAGEQSFIYMI